MTKVELFEAIRRDHLIQGKSVRQVSRERRVHRRMVRAAIASAIPRGRTSPVREALVFRRELRGLVDEWLKEDMKAPCKQRHTARRIWQRLRAEKGFGGAESTIRKYVGQRRREMGLPGEVFVPQCYRPGEEAEVDWYEAEVDFPFGRETVQVFSMRSCYSGREFHMAFPRATQQAFLEGHVAAFGHFGGVFSKIRYDNLKSAVARILRGRRRKETDRFVALRSHFLFEAVFCQPGRQGAHEKGGVEGGLGRFRRCHLVPVPRVSGYDGLNAFLLDACCRDECRRIDGKPRTVHMDWQDEAKTLRPLPDTHFPTEDVTTCRVDSKGRVTSRTNRYSVPIALAHRRVEVRVHARRVEAVHNGRVVASHERLHGTQQQRLELDHYLSLLWRKPGALAGALPLRQARERNRWPKVYDRLWDVLRSRHGEAAGTRELLHVVMLHREVPMELVQSAVELALEYGCCSAAAIAMLVRQLNSDEPQPLPLTGLGVLARYDRPKPDLQEYDQLLRGVVHATEVH